MDGSLPISRADAVRVLWKRGNLNYLRHSKQLECSRKFKASDAKRFVMNWTRRGGKSYELVLEAIEHALAGKRVLYGTGEKEATRDIVEPLLTDILEDCPQELEPKVNVQRLIWRFPSGGRIQVVGLEGAKNRRRRRGGEDDLIIVDEAAFIDELERLIESVLMARTMVTNGRILIASTPPETPAHAFKLYWDKAIANDAYHTMTIDEAPHISEETKRLYVEEALSTPGKGETWCRREYYCEFRVEESAAIIPEFSRVKAEVVQELEVPPYRHYYVAADFGFSDLTAIVFAYYDFKRAVVVIEDELVFEGKSGIEVGRAIKAKEETLWGKQARPMRIADAPMQLVADLAEVCGVTFGQARKDDAHAALNALRMEVLQRRIVVHPRCVNTINHLENGVWNTSRTSFARMDRSFGHWDFIEAVKYLCRHVNRHANPYPPLYGIDVERTDVTPEMWQRQMEWAAALSGG